MAKSVINLGPLTWAHVLLSAIDHLEFSWVLCNRQSSFFICNPQCSYTPCWLPWYPTPPKPQYRHLVVKSGTTAVQHSMSSWKKNGTDVYTTDPSLDEHPPSKAIWCPRMVLTSVHLTWAHDLLSAIDCLEFSRLLCNWPSSYFICNPQYPAIPTPCQSPWCPNPHYRHLGVKSDTTSHHHDMSSACGSDWCFVRYTPFPHYTHMLLNAPRERHLVAKSGTNWGCVDLSFMLYCLQ